MRGKMLTSQSIFEELQAKAKSFATYKELLESVATIWQKYVGVLPVEIGPKDLVELAVLRQWIQQDDSGALRIVLPKETDQSVSSAQVESSNGHKSSNRDSSEPTARTGPTSRWPRGSLRPRTARA